MKPHPDDLEAAPSKPRRAAAGARKRPNAPVTAHRLFPALAAVWFAALFGLGSLAIPGALLGAIVLKTGLPAVVPAAAPPLGFTAHLLVAFALALFGAALGLALALRLRPRTAAESSPVVVPVVVPTVVVTPVAEPEAEDAFKVRARDAHPDAPPRRPLVLAEAFADPFLEEPAEPAAPLLRRKRNQAVSEPASDNGPWIPEYVPGGTGVIRPLDLSALDLDDPFQQPAAAPILPAVEEMVEAPAQPEPAPAPEVESEPEPVAAAIPAAPALIAATPQLPAGFAASLPDAPDGKWSPVAGAPLENLGLVQLIERLALAIAEQKAANEAVIKADEAAEAAAKAAATSAEADAVSGPFSRPQIASVTEAPAVGSSREAILRRLSALVAGDMSGSMTEAATAPRTFTRPMPVPAPLEAVVPLRPAEPAVPSLSLAAAASAPGPETDEALRSALATLQRMTARA
ncbi:hypothetical protein NSE01_32920 [Novosphingobium sediminis]|uniref:Uncharacterized protein n=1 Tax=Novosphingobium sediminis TaxID=707214 RepID=A0A512AP25_9SPHN|nr:hypothetical protein NSE01_32920 [Novosphingobium sediminis]